MFPRSLVAGLLLSFSCIVAAQELHPPPSFHLVMPHGPGGILIDTTGGWKLDVFKLVDNGKRPILQMHNDAQNIIVSYIIDNAPGYYDTSEACKNDVLSGIMGGPLAKACDRFVLCREGGRYISTGAGSLRLRRLQSHLRLDSPVATAKQTK